MPYCTYCGVANVHDARFCKACAAEIGVPIINVNVVAPAMPAAIAPLPVVTLAMAATARLPLKSPLAAALLSWFWPGLGSCYVGRVGVGVAQAIFIPVVYFALLLIAAFTVDPLPLIVLLVIALAVARAAANDARQINAVRVNARAMVRQARGAGYVSPALSASPPVLASPAPQPALIGAPAARLPGAAKNTPRTWPAIIVIGAFVFVAVAVILAGSMQPAAPPPASADSTAAMSTRMPALTKSHRRRISHPAR